MPNKIYPEYRPPVTGNRARNLWNKCLGISGRLIGFELVSSDPITRTAQFSPGKFISNGCVVEVDENVEVTLPPNEFNRFFLYGYYDESSNKAGIEATLSPRDSWVILGEMVFGVWDIKEDLTAFNLWSVVEQHEAKTDIHITAPIRAAIDNSNIPSSHNRFMTDFDASIGVEYSTLDDQIEIAGDESENDSKVVVAETGINYSVESFLSIGGNHGSVVRRGGTILADKRLFVDLEGLYLPYFAGDTNYVNSNSSSEQEDEDRINSGTFNKYTVICDSHPIIVDMIKDDIQSMQGDASIVNLMAMIKPNEKTVSISIAAIMDDGLSDIVSVELDDSQKNTWMSISPNINPLDISGIKGLSIRAYGSEGMIIILSDIMVSPFVTVKSTLNYISPQPTAVKASVLSGCPNSEGISVFVSSDERASKQINLFRFNEMPPEGANPDTSIDTTTTIRPLQAMINITASEWPFPVKDYCMSDSENTGSAIILGGTYLGTPSTAVSYYNNLSDSSSTTFTESSIQAIKSGSADFSNKMIISGGEGFDANKCKSFSSFSQTHLALNDIPVSKVNCHSASINDYSFYLWGGDDDTSILRFNINSEAWTVMPDILNGHNVTCGKLFKGAMSVNRSRVDYASAVDFFKPIRSCIIAGSGNQLTPLGMKIDIGNFTPVSMDSDGLSEGSNLGITQYGTVCYQSKDEYNEYSGCYDILSASDTKVSIPFTGKGSAKSSLHFDASISFGPWEQYGIYHTYHGRFYHTFKAWLNGTLVRWENI